MTGPRAGEKQVSVVLGAQWGDEGKGKLVDLISKKYDVVCRVAGGANAGHTVVADGKKIALHLVPSSVLTPGQKIVIGNGVVIHLPTLKSEIESLEAIGLEIRNRLYISDRAHIVFDFHQVCDGIGESLLGAGKIGTTGRGIGPTYMSKADRKGVRMGYLKRLDLLEKQHLELYEVMHKRFGPFDYDVKAEFSRLVILSAYFSPMIADTTQLVHEWLQSGKHILIEGANAVMLDIDFGTYPFVTSSNPTIGSCLTGLGIPPYFIGDVYGVVKAYTTRVGSGPFPTEQLNAVGDAMRSSGAEFGTTTGRPRRCGWLDLPQLRWGALINGYSSVIVTKLDVLSDLEEIQICTSYELDGVRLTTYPSLLEDLSRVTPVYETFPGWKCDISKCRKISELPEKARQYLSAVESYLGLPINWVGVGYDRDATAMK